MIEGKHVQKQVCEAVREVARRSRTEGAAREFVDEVHDALDAMLEVLCAKLWPPAAPVADSDKPKGDAASAGDGKKKAGKKKEG